MIESKIKKILCILFAIIVLAIVFPNSVKAYDLKNRAALVKAENLGKKIRACQSVEYGPDQDVLCQCRISDHIYCVEHTNGTVNDMKEFTVKAYVRIEGDLAYGSKTSNDSPVQNEKNLTLAYVLTQNPTLYPMGYDPSSATTMRRTRAVHKLLCKGGWYEDVGENINSNLSSWVNGWDGSDFPEYDKVCDFIEDAENEAKKAENKAPFVNSSDSITVDENEKWTNGNPIIGPFKLTFNGTLNKLNVNFVGGDTLSANNSKIIIRQNNKSKKINEITSGQDFYIVNGSGKVVNNITATSTKRILKAELWFLQYDNYVQKYMLAETGTVNKTSDECTVNVLYRGSITIQKKDGDTNTNIANVGFKVQSSFNNGTWLKGTSDYQYVDEAHAQIYLTDKNGRITLTNLPTGRTYRIFEVSVPTNAGYFLDAQPNYDKDKGYIDYGNVRLAATNLNVTAGPFYNYRKGNLSIFKRDLETKNGIEGAGFKIKTSVGSDTWLSGTKEPYIYDATYDQATIYYIKDNIYSMDDTVERIESNSTEWKTGITIKNLKAGTYRLYEVVAPTGYFLEQQDNYNAEKGYVDCKEERTIPYLDQNDNKYKYNVEVGLSNVQKISIAGYVWTEGKPDKPTDSSYDSLYIKNTDHRVSNVKVRLMRKDGNNENPPTTITDENGYYIFKDLVKRTELDKYYVEFDYRDGKYSYTLNGETINKTIKDGNGHIKYIPVAFNNVENGSKALAETVPTNDASVTGVANTYKENNEEEVKVYGLSKIGTMDDENLVLNNINLGIKELLEPEFSIVKNIADVDISINSYKYKYIYGGRKTEEEGFTENTQEGPAVKWQNSNEKYTYSRPIYPSDVIYDNQNQNNKELDVKVTYKIDITNTTTYNVKELYVEKKLILESILDDYDTNRYTLLDTNWDANNGTATMKSEYLDKIQTEINENKEKGLMSEKTTTAYITFSVNKNAIIDILNHPEGIIENNPTKVIVKGYHLYNRDDYMWNNLKTNSGQIKVNKEHQTESQTQVAEAPYLVFTIKPDGIIERTVSGKVFKDNVTVERGNNGEVVGDGKHQDNEKGIEGVKVELLGEDMKVTKLYQLYTENNVDKTRIIDAIVTTNQDGDYSLNGVVPGKYYLRFTYGNGTYRITDLTGAVIKEGTFETKIGENTIAAKDYKSTIMNSEIVNIIKNKAELWYKEDGFKGGKYSLALDNLEKRIELNEAEANKTLNDSEKIKEISADTSKISVTIENTKNDEAKEAEETTNKQISANNSSGNQTKILLNDQKKNIKFEFGGFYFGLIEMPKQELKIEKLIKNVLIKNGQTNVFYNGNPEEVAKQGAGVVTVTDLDKTTNGGSTYTRAEMVEASISGSDLRIAYEIKITNVSDVNYYNEEYYKFGIINKTKEVTVTPTKVYDYLDEILKYDPESLDSEKFHEKYKSDKDRIEEYQETDEEVKNNEKELKAKAYKLKGGPDQDKWITLYTDKIKNRDSNHPTSDAVIIVASKPLSMKDLDWIEYNRAEIKNAVISPDLSDIGTADSEKEKQLKIAAKEVKTNGMAETLFTLIIPTGEDRYSTTLYAIAGIIALIILSTGIVIIKKKII